MGIGWSQIWRTVVAIVVPIVGPYLRTLALKLWEIVEEWAKGLLSETGKKPTSEEKAAMFGKLLEHLEPDLPEEKVAFIREIAHKQQTAKLSKTPARGGPRSQA